MSSYSILAASLAALLIILSTIQLALSAYIIHYDRVYSEVGNRTFRYLINSGLRTFVYNFFFLPLHNLTRSYTLQLTTAVLALLYGIVVLCLSFRSKPFTFVGTGKHAPRTIAWSGITTGLCILVFCLTLPTLVITFYDNANYGQHTVNMGICLGQHSTSNSVSNCNGANSAVAQSYTIEGWVCEMSGLYIQRISYGEIGSNANHVLPRTCTISRLSRWWTIPLFILPIMIGISAFLEKRRKNIVAYNTQREQSADLYPRHTSYDSHAPTEIESPVSPISTLPRYSSMNTELHGQSRTNESGGKMLQEVPEKLEYDEMPAAQHQVYSELSASRSRLAVKE